MYRMVHLFDAIKSKKEATSPSLFRNMVVIYKPTIMLLYKQKLCTYVFDFIVCNADMYV